MAKGNVGLEPELHLVHLLIVLHEDHAMPHTPLSQPTFIWVAMIAFIDVLSAAYLYFATVFGGFRHCENQISAFSTFCSPFDVFLKTFGVIFSFSTF